MRKRIYAVFAALLLCVLMVGVVSAAEPVSVDTWEELKQNLESGTSVVLIKDIPLNETLTIGEGKTVTLDLASYTLSNTSGMISRPIVIDGGDLTIKASGGKIVYNLSMMQVLKGKLTLDSGTFTTGTTGNVVNIAGSTESSDEDYSTLIVGEDAVLESGYYAVSVHPSTTKQYYGILVDIAGTLQPCSPDSYGCGIGVNGNFQERQDYDYDYPVEVLIRGTAKIISNDAAVYGAGYANWTIEDGANIEGKEALSIKSGKWTILGGDFIGTRAYVNPVQAQSSASEDTGAAVSVTTNPGYAQNVELIISGGTFTGEDQSALFEGSASKNGIPYPGSALKKVEISGGTFTTQNETLSPITIQNSADVKNITGGISIKDADGTNLLYPGVSLLSAGDTAATFDVKWTGTDGSYAATISKEDTYKLACGFDTTADVPFKINVPITLDGNDMPVTVTKANKGALLTVPLAAAGTTLQNLNITASGIGNPTDGTIYLQGKTTLLNSYLNLSEVKNEGRSATNGIRLLEDADGSVLIGNTILASASPDYRVYGVLCYASDVIIQDNYIDGGHGGSITNFVLSFAGTADNISIVNNTLTRDDPAGAGNCGISIWTDEDASFEIVNNTFSLVPVTADSDSGAVIRIDHYAKNSATISIDAHQNIVKQATHGIRTVPYTDNPKLTIEGSVYDNDFSGVANKAFFYEDSSSEDFSGVSWNTTVTEGENIIGGTHIAGNWWGTASANLVTETGYTEFTDANAALAAGFPAADLAPLTLTGTKPELPTGTTVEIKDGGKLETTGADYDETTGKATITDTTSSLKLVIAYDTTDTQSQEGTITGTPKDATLSYNSDAGTLFSGFKVTVPGDKAGDVAGNLPVTSDELTDSTKQSLKEKGYEAAKMLTVAATQGFKDAIQNQDVVITFSIPETDVLGLGGPQKVCIIHIDDNNIVTEINSNFRYELKDGNYIFSGTSKLGFSSYGLVSKVDGGYTYQLDRSYLFNDGTGFGVLEQTAIVLPVNYAPNATGTFSTANTWTVDVLVTNLSDGTTVDGLTYTFENSASLNTNYAGSSGANYQATAAALGGVNEPVSGLFGVTINGDNLKTGETYNVKLTITTAVSATGGTTAPSQENTVDLDVSIRPWVRAVESNIYNNTKDGETAFSVATPWNFDNKAQIIYTVSPAYNGKTRTYTSSVPDQFTKRNDAATYGLSLTDSCVPEILKYVLNADGVTYTQSPADDDTTITKTEDTLQMTVDAADMDAEYFVIIFTGNKVGDVANIATMPDTVNIIDVDYILHQIVAAADYIHAPWKVYADTNKDGLIDTDDATVTFRYGLNKLSTDEKASVEMTKSITP